MDDQLPAAVPAFAAHFTDPIYDDPAGEFAPFGTDEGFDPLYEWADRSDELGPGSTVEELIGQSGFDDIVEQLGRPEHTKIPSSAGPIDAATITVGAAFTLLRLTGRHPAAPDRPH